MYLKKRTTTRRLIDVHLRRFRWHFSSENETGELVVFTATPNKRGDDRNNNNNNKENNEQR